MFAVNDKGLLPLSDELGEILTRIQRQGNKDVDYKTDLAIYNTSEYWSYPKQDGLILVGDCEDIALHKRRLLMREGIDPTAVLLTICKDPKGNGHCVLCVCTDERDFLMCNNHETLVSPKTMVLEGYHFLYRQKLGHPIDAPWDVLK